jgi:hypothetical protein
MSSDDDLKIHFKRPDATAEKMRDIAIPGFAVECDPEEADAMGAFAEEALDWDEALDAALDLNREDITNA